MIADPFDEVFNVANRPDLAEVGGSHNQKGIEFQRHWSLMRMFELEEAGTTDFLILFEAIQDVAILDSSSLPTAICVYQVKKKDRKEWTWNDLTALRQPKNGDQTTMRQGEALAGIRQSPLGKLYATVIAFKNLISSAKFVSNAGCDLPLENVSSAA